MKMLLMGACCALVSVGALAAETAIAVVDGVCWHYEPAGGEARLVGGDPAYAGDLVVPAALGGFPVTAVDESAFGFNPGVTSVTLPAGVTNLPFHAFCSSHALTNIVFQAPFVHFCESSLSGTALTRAVVFEGETRLEPDVFQDDAYLASLTLPSTLRTMGHSACYGCTALKEVRFPAGFRSFDAVRYGSQQQFAYCTGLEHAYFEGPLPDHLDTSGLLRYDCKIHYPRAYAEGWAAVVPAGRFGGYTDEGGPDADGVCWRLVGGVRWHYVATDGEARIVGGDPAYAGDLVVPAMLGDLPVTAVDESAFGFNPNVTSVTLPAGVTNLPFHAFCNAASLTNVVFTAPSFHLGESCLSGTALRSFAVPEGETRLETDVFHDCASLASVALPSTLESMGRSVFRKCGSLAEIRFPAGFAAFEAVPNAAERPFDRCAGLEHSYFYGPVPANLACSGLLEQGLIHYPRAFAAEWEAVVPDDRFGGYTDEGAPDPAGVCARVLDGVTWYYTVRNGEATVVGGEPAYAGDLVVPESLRGRRVVAVDESSFGFNTNVTSVVLPAGVTNLPFHAFCSSHALTNIVFQAPFVHFCESSLSGTALTRAVVFEGETRLEPDVFQDDAYLASLTLPSTLRTMGHSACYGCTALKEVRFPAGFRSFDAVRYGSQQQFAYCTGLEHAYFEGPLPDHLDTSGLLRYDCKIHYPRAYAEAWEAAVPAEKFGGYTEDEPGREDEPPAVEVQVARVDGMDWHYVATNGEARVVGGVPPYAGDLAVPAELGGLPVTAVDESAFGFNTNVTSVVLPAGVTNLPFHAFCNAASLTNVVFTAPSFHLGESCLSGTRLAAFAVPEGETRLETDVFHGCTALASVALPSTLESMGRSAFRNCASLAEIRFPAGFTAFAPDCEEDQRAFDGCTGLADSWFFGPPPTNFETSGLLQYGRVHYPREWAEAWAALVPDDRFGGYSDGAAQPLPPCPVRIEGYDGVYDGRAHGVAVAELAPGADVVYAPSEAELLAGRGLPVAPLFTNVVDAVVWYQASCSNYLPVAGRAEVRIRPRPVTLASRAGWKMYDGLPLVRDRVVAGGMGFVDGEGVEVRVTGVQTEIGSSDNVFTWNPLPGTVTSNYEIAVLYGRLQVTKGPLGTVILVRGPAPR